MSTEEDLIAYSDEELDEPVTSRQPKGSGSAQLPPGDGAADKKGSYVGIHSTGFRDFLLKPELLRAIVDCGFEHPSEGTIHAINSSL